MWDELGFIGEWFNVMVFWIDMFIYEVYEWEFSEKEVEFKVI